MLALRLRVAYDRWWQARVGFGSIGGRLTTLMRMAHCWFRAADEHGKVCVWGGVVCVLCVWGGVLVVCAR